MQGLPEKPGSKETVARKRPTSKALAASSITWGCLVCWEQCRCTLDLGKFSLKHLLREQRENHSSQRAWPLGWGRGEGVSGHAWTEGPRLAGCSPHGPSQPLGNPHSWGPLDTIQLVKAKYSLQRWGRHFYTVEEPLTRQLTSCHKASEENAEEWLTAACLPDWGHHFGGQRVCPCMTRSRTAEAVSGRGLWLRRGQGHDL